jgi:hypothetical protein
VLSPDEREQVTRLRDELRSLISLRNQQGIGFFSAGEEPLTELQQKQLKESRDRMRHLMVQAWAIADRHEAEIHGLLKPAAGHKESWRDELQKILAKSLGKRYLVIADAGIAGRIESRQFPEYFAPVVFLLWDPQQPFLTEDLIK